MRRRRQLKRTSNGDSRVAIVGQGAAARDAAVAEGLDVIEGLDAAGMIGVSPQKRAGLAVRDPLPLGLLLSVGRVLWRGVVAFWHSYRMRSSLF